MMDRDEIHKKIRQKYAKAITVKNSLDNSSASMITEGLYTPNELAGLPAEMVNTSFGCGNPTSRAQLHPGEIVLDLGSGAGLDVLLSAHQVGKYGKVYGLDMTEEMLAEANANKAKAGITNAEFLKGHIEAIPLSEAAVDVVISNCVINLSVDKDQVFREIYRVLKPGGRLAVADIITTMPLPDGIKKKLLVRIGCLAGTLVDEEYKEKLVHAGFENIGFEIIRTYDVANLLANPFMPDAMNEEYAKWNGVLVSAFIRAQKPGR